MKIALFGFLICCGTFADVRITTLDGPLFPLHLGIAKNKISHWTTVVHCDLRPLIDQIDQLNERHNELLQAIKELPDSEDKETLKILNVELKTQIEQLNLERNQLIPTIRKARGAFNFVGSIIKAISGNLDAEDATRYDQLIQELTQNQKELMKNTQAQIHLARGTLVKYEDNLKNLADNQYETAKYLQNIVEYIKQQEQESSRYKTLWQAHTLLTITVNAALTMTNRLLTAKTFAKLETYHPAIISAEELLTELDFIQSSINDQEIVLTPIPENLYTIEKAITIKAYVKEYTLTFLLEIPLIEPAIYQYHKIIPLPIHQNSSYLILNTPQPYLAENKNRYLALEQPCILLQHNEYLCDALSLDAEKHTTCAYQLLRHLPITACTYTDWPQLDTEISHPTNSDWIIFQTNQSVDTQCGLRQEIGQIQGNTLVQLTSECTLSLGKEVLRTTAIHIIDRPIYLTPFNITSLPSRKPHWQLENIRLKTLNLETFNETKNDLIELEEQLRKLSNSHVTSIWSSTTSLIVTGIIVLIIIMGVRCYRTRRITHGDSVTQAPELNRPNPWLTLRGEELSRGNDSTS